MLDQFDRSLLDILQRDASLTTEALSERVALSPSAIARRLRRLHKEHWIAQTIALLSPRVVQHRSRAIVLIQFHDNVDGISRAKLRARLSAVDEVQFCYEVTGANDMIVMVDCADLSSLHELIDDILSTGGIVRRHEINFVKREAKFAPFVDLSESPREADRPLFGRTQPVLSLVRDTPELMPVSRAGR